MNHYTEGTMVKLVTGEIGEIVYEYDNIYRVWIAGHGMVYVHGSKILRAVKER